jgi:signal transduction histidine kinase/FixJ family two-component response regulator
MHKPPKEKPFLQAIRGKVIAAFLLTFTAIVFALAITYFSFNDLLSTVDHLASPNEKLRKLNTFFQQVTQLDQQQRAEAIKNPQKPSEEFLRESKALLLRIDTLREMDWKDPQQIERMNAMEKILIRRDELFLSYLKLKSDFIFNPHFSKRLDSLSGILSNNRTRSDTSVRTTQKKVITKTTAPDTKDVKTEDNRSFFSRLFSRKKDPKSTEPKVEVQEELSVKIDTLAIAQQDSVIGEVGRIMKSLEKDQRQQNKNMIQGELELINTNTILINQLIGILHQVEEEELALMHKNSKEATQLVSSTIKRIGLIMLLFFLGAAVLVFLILTDIAGSNYYRKQLLKAKEEAEQLGLVKQRFLANMSHEIRTPLQSIIGFSEQMRKDYPDGKEALDAIHSSSEHLLHIVNEVLDYSRIESGKFTMEREPFNLGKVLREVSAGIEIQAEQKGLTFIQEINTQADIILLGDGFRLRQILYNLLGNAVKFTSKGFVKLSTIIDNSDYTVKCKFQITDSGIGMDPKDIERVFQQFEQANASINHHYGGTGLGLTIVKALVEAQNGNLVVSSELGKGSTFTILLNYDRAPRASVKSVQLEKVENRRSLNGKVLIVDDDPLILKLCSLILRKHSIDHITFQDPHRVKQYTGFDNIDLVLLDIRMPNINGIELCHTLRKKVKKDTRIVALTAHVLPQERAGLIEECFDEILTKPFREQQLLDVIGVQVSNEKVTAENDGTVDFSAIKKMAMGDDALFHSIVAQFIVETEGDISLIKSKVVPIDEGNLREIVHKLAGRTGQMGMPIVSSRFREIEKALDEGKSIGSLRSGIDQALQDLENIIKEIQEDVVNS